MKTKKLLFILNPRAGRNKPHGPLFDALAILSGAGYLIRIHETSAPGDAADTAAREGAGYDLVVAAGGDGTLNEVISGLMRLDAPPPPGWRCRAAERTSKSRCRPSGRSTRGQRTA